jgi:hypothetical protein
LCLDALPLGRDIRNTLSRAFLHALQRFLEVLGQREILEVLEDLSLVDIKERRSEELMTDLGDDEDDEDRAGRAPWEADPLEVAWSVVQATFEQTDQALEARVTEWLAQDPDHWPIFRLVVLDLWQEQPGQLRKEASSWGRSLGTNTTIATVQQDPYGRQRVVD